MQSHLARAVHRQTAALAEAKRTNLVGPTSHLALGGLGHGADAQESLQPSVPCPRGFEARNSIRVEGARRIGMSLVLDQVMLGAKASRQR